MRRGTNGDLPSLFMRIARRVRGLALIVERRMVTFHRPEKDATSHTGSPVDTATHHKLEPAGHSTRNTTWTARQPTTERRSDIPQAGVTVDIAQNVGPEHRAIPRRGDLVGHPTLIPWQLSHPRPDRRKISCDHSLRTRRPPQGFLPPWRRGPRCIPPRTPGCRSRSSGPTSHTGSFRRMVRDSGGRRAGRLSHGARSSGSSAISTSACSRRSRSRLSLAIGR